MINKEDFFLIIFCTFLISFSCGVFVGLPNNDYTIMCKQSFEVIKDKALK